MVKMQLTDNQTAFEHAIYMIVGSYFNNHVKMYYRKERCMELYEADLYDIIGNRDREEDLERSSSVVYGMRKFAS